MLERQKSRLSTLKDPKKSLDTPYFSFTPPGSSPQKSNALLVEPPKKDSNIHTDIKTETDVAETDDVILSDIDEELEQIDLSSQEHYG